MKKKVKIICTLKSGVKLTDSIKVDQKDKKARDTLTAIIQEIKDSMNGSDSEAGQLTWGTTVFKLSEVAAVKFKEY